MSCTSFPENVPILSSPNYSAGRSIAIKFVQHQKSRNQIMNAVEGAPPLGLRRLWRGVGAELLTTRWSAAEHPIIRHGSTDFAVIEVMLAGTFEKRCNQGHSSADVNTAMLFDPGEAFEIAHTSCSANAGLTIRIAPEAVARWLPSPSAAHGALSARWGSMTRVVSPAAILEAHRLARRLSDDPETPPAACVIERQVADFILMLLGGGLTPMPRYSACERVDRARAYLNMNFASTVRRRDVAKKVGCSPWLLSREFTRHVGLSLHEYLMKLRLRAALRALADGCDDLTALALRLGFASHSHFSAAFKAEFGGSPRSIRHGLARSC